MRRLCILLGVGLFVTGFSTSAEALRYHPGDPLMNKLVLSLFAGGGIPLSDFHSRTRGNHEAGGADVALEVEWYATREYSLGLAIWGGLYDDRTFGDALQTDITIYGGFIKYTVRTETDVYPYLKLGVGAAELEFNDRGLSFEVDTALALLAGTGVMWRVSELVSVNGQVTYNYTFTEDKDIPALFPPSVVSFDTQYIGINVGISFFLF